MMRVEISIKMERLAELIARSPNRLEDIRDLCLEYDRYRSVLSGSGRGAL